MRKVRIERSPKRDFVTIAEDACGFGWKELKGACASEEHARAGSRVSSAARCIAWTATEAVDEFAYRRVRVQRQLRRAHMRHKLLRAHRHKQSQRSFTHSRAKKRKKRE